MASEWMKYKEKLVVLTTRLLLESFPPPVA